jgi:hypothetical protein
VDGGRAKPGCTGDMNQAATGASEGGRCQHRAVVVACVLALLAGGCAGTTPASQPTHPTGRATPSNAATPAPAAPLSQWQKRGATEVPPDDLQRVSLSGVEVVNQTGGAIGDGDARAWAEAFLRSYGYVLWAVSRGQDRFLLASGLGSAPGPVFRPNVNDVLLARQASSRVEYSREAFRRIVLRSVPQNMQKIFKDLQFVWKPYALFLDAVGPITTTWIDAQGSRTVKSQIGAGTPVYELIGGELGHDPLMGDIWVLGSDWNCTAASSRQGLAPLCNP